MKIILKIACLLLLSFIANAQHSKPGSLRKIVQTTTTDSARHNASYNLYLYFLQANRDSAFLYVAKRLTPRENKGRDNRGTRIRINYPVARFRIV